jgi:acyl-CoA synthetase (NDP forming)
MNNTLIKSKRDLQSLFEAESVVIIGASADETKLNGLPLHILQMHNYKGSIYLVNPKYDKIQDLKCYRTIAELPEAADVALIAIPAEFVPETAEQCGQKGIRNLIILSSGFEEVGDQGKKLAEKLLSVTRQYGMNVVGPNCEGLWSVPNRMILTFGSAAKRERIDSYPVGVISQSGSIGGALVRKLYERGIGVSYFISVGNETDLTVTDFIDYMVESKKVKVIALFLEGLKDGIDIVKTSKYALSKGVQLLVLKSGSSEAGKKATASHTGKIASSQIIYTNVFKQAGIIELDSFNELLETTILLSHVRIQPKQTEGYGIGVLSISGGARALIIDSSEKWNVPLAVFEEKTVQRLKSILPFYGVAENPADVTGQIISNQKLFEESLEAASEDSNVEVLLIQYANRGKQRIIDMQEFLIEFATKVHMPIILSTLGDEIDQTDQLRLLKNNIVCSNDPVTATKYLNWLYHSGRCEQQAKGTHQLEPAKVNGSDNDGPEALSSSIPTSFQELEEEMKLIGLSTPKSVIIRSNSNLEQELKELKYPLVVKALPEQLEHKTEYGAVHVNINTMEEVKEKIKSIQSILGKESPVLVQEMVTGGFEMILSIINDQDFGPVLSIGTGGIFIELFKDIKFLQIPCNPDEITLAIKALRANQVLQGYRGKGKFDIEAIVKAASNLSDYYLRNFPNVMELEINPIIVLPEGQGAVAVDLLIK